MNSATTVLQRATEVTAYAAIAPHAPLEAWSYEPGPLRADEVDIAVTHCGVCHTDIHLIDNDLGASTYPLVPGHEVVGTVTAIGAAVTTIAPGQRVGAGWQRGACNECEWCRQGLENLCAASRPTCLAGYGGFAQSVRVDSRFAIPIPDALESVVAAPLLCGGITVYAPLCRLVHPGTRVGVVGIGGLGHLAVQFARAMGAEVFAFSTSPDKLEAARQFGAHHCFISADRDAMKRANRRLDVLISTAAADLDWAFWLGTLRPNGRFCLLGASPGPISLPTLPMIFGQFSFSASIIGPPRQMEEMLRFAALHGVRPAVEVLPFKQVNEALERVRTNQARFRMVLES